jgi:hypothetical protein
MRERVKDFNGVTGKGNAQFGNHRFLFSFSFE